MSGRLLARLLQAAGAACGKMEIKRQQAAASALAARLLLLDSSSACSDACFKQIQASSQHRSYIGSSQGCSRL
jgi:hypothetical protein